MPAKTLKKQPNASKQAKATAEKSRTNAITPSAQNNEGLPAGWRKVNLGEVAKYINGKAFKPSEWSRVGLPIIRIQNLNRDKSEFNCCNFNVDEKYLVNSGDLLFAWSGTPDTSFGAHIWRGPKAVLNQHIFRIVVNEQIISKSYYLHALNHKVKEFVSKAHGTAGLAHITKKKFEESEIYLPPIPDQHAIVSKIEELLSELDKGKQQLETAQQQLKIYRQAVLKWAFEGKLSASEFSGLQNEQNGNATKSNSVKSSNSVNSASDNLLKGWRWVKLKDVSKVISGFAFKSSDFIDEGVPVIKIANVGYSTFEWKAQQFLPKNFLNDHENFKIVGGDLLIALTRPITNNTTKVCKYPTNSIPALLNQRVAAIKELETAPDYLFWYFQTDGFKNYIRSKFSETLQPNLSPKDLELTPLPFAPIDEQILIVQQIESRLSVCDKVEETITISLAQAETLRQSILKKAFEGKLV